MDYLSDSLIGFIKRHDTTYVATANGDGQPNVVPKGTLHVEDDKTVYILDLYKGRTRSNLEKNNRIALTLIDQHAYCGFQIKGTAQIIEKGQLFEKYVNIWKERKQAMMTKRIIGNLQKGRASGVSEKDLPHPMYLIKVSVTEVLDLSPKNNCLSEE